MKKTFSTFLTIIIALFLFIISANIDMYGQTGIAMALFFTEADVFFSGMMHMHYLYITEIIVLFSCEFLYINFVRYQRSVVGNAKNKDQEPDR